MSRRDKTNEKILHELREETHILREIEKELSRASIRIVFSDSQGVLPMPISLNVGQSVVSTAVETDATGNTVAIANPSTINWVSSDPTIATARNIGDGTGEITSVAAGEITLTVTDTANGLTTSDTVTVVAVEPPPPPPDTPTAIAIEFGTPTP